MANRGVTASNVARTLFRERFRGRYYGGRTETFRLRASEMYRYLASVLPKRRLARRLVVDRIARARLLGFAHREAERERASGKSGKDGRRYYYDVSSSYPVAMLRGFGGLQGLRGLR